MIRMISDLPTLDFAKSDQDAPASISGIAVPWAPVTATVLGGQRVAFERGAFDVNQKAAKLIEGHDLTQLRGTVNSLADMPEGLGFTATFARTRASADAVELIRSGAYDAVSVGAEVQESYYDKELKATVVTRASLVELSLVAVPAFSGAEIQTLVAQADEPDETESPTETTPPTPSEEDEMSEPTTVEAAVATQPIYATAKQEFKMPSAGEWIAAQFAGGSVAAEFNARLRAAAPSVTTADLDGIMPTPIVAPIYSGIQGLRPVVDAIGARNMPQGGKVFIVPKITTHVSIGGPETQNTTITAGQFIVDDIQVTKAIYGGYVQLSEASIDWSDPEVLGALLEDLARKYALFTDNVAADALLAGTTQATGNVAPTDPADWVAKIYACANTILSAGNYLPDHLFVSGDVFAQLGSLSDTSDRPLFPQVGPMNAFGSMNAASRESTVFGLKLVVDTNFAAKTTIVGAAATGAFRCYEQQKGAIVADIGAGASTLSRDVAFRGYFAPIMVDANQFMKIPQA
jgi:HK97 family phage prohead protease